MRFAAALAALAATSTSSVTLSGALPSKQFHDARSVVVAAEEATLAARGQHPAHPNGNSSASGGGDDNDSNIIYPSFDTTSCPGYKPAGPVKQSKAGFTMPLTLAGPACNAYGVDIADLTLSVIYEKAHQLHVHIYDTAKTQFQLPLDGDGLFTRLSSDPEEVGDQASTQDESQLVFNHAGEDVNDGTWGFWITRKGEDDNVMPLFDTRSARIPTYSEPLEQLANLTSNRNTTAMPNQKMIFENQYVQLASALPEDANIYGLGERYSGGGIGDASWRLNPDNMLQPFFALDVGDPPESNMYGYQPIYMEVRNATKGDDVDAHVVAYQNTAGLDIMLRRGLIQYRGIGGTLDFRFFSGKQSSDSKSGEHTHYEDSNDEDSATKRDTDDDLDAETNPSSPQIAMEQYVQYVNLPLMNPLWSFGYHQLRWGIRNVSELRDLHQSMRQANIPLETMWNDIDYLKAYRDFTVDPNSYGNLSEFIDELHSQHQHYIPIIDAAIPATPLNKSDHYVNGERGRELDVFMRNANGSLYVGEVWPGWTFFIDEHNKNAQQWWQESYANLTQGSADYKPIHLDGLWIDMNEPSSPFTLGSAGDPQHLNVGGNSYKPDAVVSGWPEGYNPNTSGRSGNITVDGQKTYTGDNKFYNDSYAIKADAMSANNGDPNARHFNPNDTFLEPASHRYHNSTQRFLTDPPYEMHNGWNTYPGPVFENLDKKTVAMEVNTAGGKFYDVKNLDGSLLVHHAYESLRALRPKERPFIVSRSTYPGFGGYANHWLGDNTAHWGLQGMAKNIQGALQFQLFGIPTVGADTCGFNGNTDEELCNRWMALSAFMPFFRNHNTINALSQEPFRWESVANSSRIAIGKRYELLPEIYTQRARSSQRGTPMVKSLWMEFPSNDQFEQLRKTDTQYMFGPNLLVSSVLEPSVDYVKAYFPDANGKWRNVFSYEALDVKPNTNTSIPAPLSSINVHQRPGSAMLSYTGHGYTIYETSQRPYTLLVNLNNDGRAQGSAYIDDGTSMPPTPSREISFVARNNSLVGKQSGDYQVPIKLENVVLMGVSKKPSSLTAQGKDVLSNAHFDSSRQLLNATNLGIDLNQGWKLEWSM